ncbi:hypothetical protein DLREEDagrD3_17720 [Denitratisoma sp. agr-D3]
MKRLFYFCLLFVALSAGLATPASADEPGKFIGRVVTEWLKDDPEGRKMRLLEPFAFIDPAGVRWDAPAGWVVDGASIPQVAWSLIGGPYEGKYREASVIHDVACDEKDRPWQAVHRVFYDAMLASNVDGKKAKIMYAAVYHFGPRWPLEVSTTTLPIAKVDTYAKAITPMIDIKFDESLKVVTKDIPRKGPACPKGVSCLKGGEVDLPPTHATVSVRLVPSKSTLSEAAFDRLKQSIETQDLSLEQIENFK